jgi:putative addiction module CopG family antidote
MSKIGKDSSGVLCSGAMKTQALNVNLTAELRRYVKEQVRAGRYQNENEVVRDAIRQMQQREIEQFERLFADYPGSPQGEPTTTDDEAIQAAIQRHRDANRAKRAA